MIFVKYHSDICPSNHLGPGVSKRDQRKFCYVVVILMIYILCLMFWCGTSQSALIHSPDAYKPSSPQAGSLQGPSRRSVTIFASDIVWQKKASNSSEANWPVWTQWRPSAGRCVHNRSSGCKGSGASGSGITDTSRFFAHSWIHWIRGFLLIKSPTHLPRASPIPCKAGTLEL